jgi:peptidoglycan hydrolase-like protein with peptidoglycan-binding domain
MLLAGKAACVGIAFILLTIGISGPRPTPLHSANLSQEVPAVGPRNDVKKMQETLRDKGHYSGEVDGVLGLRTRASIRGFQKTENLPVTGQLDARTADKLGVRPEVREEAGYETTQGKPSAGIKRAKSSTSKTLRKAVKTVAVSESGRGDREKTLQAESENHPR